MRVSGWLLIVLGLSLSLGIAALAWFLFCTIVQDSHSGSHPRWHGTPEFTRTTFEFFGAVFLFGLTAIAAGTYQLWAGRRHPFLVVVTLLLAGAMIYLGYGIVSTPSVQPCPDSFPVSSIRWSAPRSCWA